eukprot:gene2553-biopygen2048
MAYRRFFPHPQHVEFDAIEYRHAPFLSQIRLLLCVDYGQHVLDQQQRHLHQRAESSAETSAESGQLGDVTTPEQLIQDVARGDSLMLGDRLNSVPEQFFLEELRPGCFNVSGYCDDFIQLLHVPDMPPLLAGILTTDVYVFTVDCLMNRNESLATAKRKFVLLSFNDDFPFSIVPAPHIVSWTRTTS